MQSLQHDVAMDAAKGIVALIAPSATDEELRELFNRVYDALMVMLRRYEEKAERREARLGRR